MTDTPTFKPGDVVNGHVLTEDGQWVPISAPPGAPASTVKKKRTGLKIASGIVAAFVLIGIIGAATGDDTTKDTKETSAHAEDEAKTKGDATESTVEEPAEEPVTEPSPAAKPQKQEKTRARPAAPETFVMPPLVGMNLQDAQDTLQAAGSYILTQTDATGMERFQVLDSGWKVCYQKPVAGAKVPLERMVDLGAVKLDEACP
jgi:hypothetical protein